MDTPVLARMTTPVTGSPFETVPGIARAFPMEKVAFPGAGEADRGPPSRRRRLDYPAPVAGRLALHAAAWRDITDSAYVLQAVQGYLLDFHTRPPIMSARQANATETTMNSGKAELLDAEVTELLRKGAIEKCNRGPGFLQSDVPCPQERGQITSDNQPKTTQSVCANASFHHDNPEGCEATHPAGGLGRVFGPERRLFSCAGPHTSQTLSPVYMEGTDISIHSLALRTVYQPLLLHESDKTNCTVPTLTGRQGSVLSGRCVAASSDQTRRTREQEKSRASVGQTRFLSKPRKIRLRAPAVFFLPRTSVGHPFNAGSLAIGQGGGDTLSGSQSSRPEGCVGKKPDDLFGEGVVCVVRCRAGSTPLAGAANCSEDSLQTPTGHMQDSTPTQGGSPQSQLLERADHIPSPSAPSSSGDNYGNRRFVIGMGRQSSRIIGQRPLVQGSEVTPHKLPGTDGLREFASVISGQGGREDCVRPDRQQNSVAYLAKEGGTKSVLLSRLACRILLWCQRHRVTLIPVYVRGIGNTIADALSRGQETQWHLSPKMVDRIFRRYGTPQVDLFASRETALLPQYMTLQRGDNQGLAVDALSQTWDFDLVYAFPPPTLVPTVANKLRGSKARMLLIAPCWCDAPWMPVLTELLFDTPRLISMSPRLLINTATNTRWATWRP